MTNEPKKLLNKNYLLLWQGQTVSRLGNQIFLVSLILWLTYTVNLKSLVGLLGMIASLPAVMLSAFGGVFADRFSRKKIIIISDVFNGLLILSLAATLHYFPDRINLIVGHIFLISILSAITSAFFQPAISASIPDLVPKEEIFKANTMGQFSIRFSMVFGQTIGAALYQWLGLPIITLIDGITFLFSAVSESFITIPQRIKKVQGSFRDQFQQFQRDFKEGLEFVWQQKGLKTLIIGSLFLNFFTMAVMVLLPFYLKDTLQVPKFWFGILTGAYAVGSFLGYTFAGFIKIPPRPRAILINIFMVVNSLLLGALGVTSNAVVASVLFGVSGILGGFIQVNIFSILQITTPSEIRGRVFGFISTLSGSIAPLGMGLGGVIGDVSGLGIPVLYLITGGIMVIISSAVAINAEARKFLSFDVRKAAQVSPAAEARDFFPGS